ncbi:MAG: hypothetical protein ACJ8DI_27970 [Ktedonobacteraceae bacterium]
MAEFPENHVEILHNYLLPSRTVATELSKVVTGVPNLPGNQPAISVNRARETLLRFLHYPSLDDLLSKLTGQDGIYEGLEKRDFQLALERIDALQKFYEKHPPTNVPTLFPGTLATAFGRDTIDYKFEFVLDDTVLGKPRKIGVTLRLPGYNGPPLDQTQRNQLLELNEFITGGPEHHFRLGLLRAECHFGLQQYEHAITEYSSLLANANTLPLRDKRRKFLAIRLGFAHLAQGDALFRRSRVLTDGQRNQVLIAYNTAIQHLQKNAVSPDNPLHHQIVAYAQAQISKVIGGFNFFGYHDSYVPLLRPEKLRDLASARVALAKGAAHQFEDFLTKATALERLADEYDREMAIADDSIKSAQERVGIASDQIDKADETINEITDQINDLKTSSFISGFEFLVEAAAFGTAAVLTGGAAAAGVAATAVGSANGFTSTALGYGSRSDELEHQRQIAELERDNAEHEQRIAQLEEDIAQINQRFAQNQFEIVHGGRLNADLYYALANIFEDLTIRHMAVATQFAYLYERAVAFRWLIPDLRIIKFDYLDAGQNLTQAILDAADLLEADLARVNEKDVPTTKGHLLSAETISLRQQYPIQFNQLNQTGHMDFALSLYDLDKRRPGVYQGRIERVNVQVVGLIPPTGFTGHITHHGSFLLRDISTLSAHRFIPTAAELAQALKELQAGGAQGHAVGGIIPIVLDPDRKELSQEIETSSSENSRVFGLALMEGYGPAAAWSLELRNIDPRQISDVLLILALRIPEAEDRLEQHVRELIKSYEQELAAGDALDRIGVIFLRQQRPDALAQLKATGEASFQVLESDLLVGLTEVKVKTIIGQTIDKDEKGVAGIALEITKLGTAFSIARTSRQDGYSEDLSSPPSFVAPADRVPMLGTWQIRLPDPVQGSTFDDVLLFFIYEFKEL